MKNLLSFVLLSGAVIACDDNTASKATDYTALLQPLTHTAALPAHAAFTTKADALAAAVASLDPASLAGPQQAWRDARSAWRALDALHFGPVADLGISERIDLGPVDVQGVDGLAAAGVAAAGGKSKGFLGLEYLLFAPDASTKLVDANRRALAKAMADEIASSAHQLNDAWDPAKGGYANDVLNAGAASKRYPSQRAAVDDFVAGVGFALELIVGVRLANPLGRNAGGTPDPSQDPTRLSDSAIADMTSSLQGIRAVYQGEGFSTRVRAKNVALDTSIQNELSDCASKLASIPKPFATTVTSNTPAVDTAYQSCKALKATWNADITSALGATLKPADNDGD